MRYEQNNSRIEKKEKEKALSTHSSWLMARPQSGFAMLFAVLASSLVLSIGLSIFNLTLKELTLSSSGRESQFAFYAADSGAECALYWDLEATHIFATSSSAYTPSNSAPECNLQPINITASPRTPTSATTQFQFDVYKPGDATASWYCAKVKLVKTAVGGLIETVIESRGYNNQCGLLSTTDINRVERALRIRY